MKEKFLRFMQGRYGSDQLTRFMLWINTALIVLGFFVHSPILYAVIVLMLSLTYFRVFSKNIDKRYAENMFYLKIENKLRSLFNGFKNQLMQAKSYHIYKCPSCGQKLRVPRGRGKITITCAKCKGSFTKKS